MSYQEFQENLKIFSDLIKQFSESPDKRMNKLLKRYVEQNIVVLNDVLTCSNENLQKIKKAKSANDIICMQAKFIKEINKKLSLISHRFLNESLGHIADYNEWLKAHCDLATD